MFLGMYDGFLRGMRGRGCSGSRELRFFGILGKLCDFHAADCNSTWTSLLLIIFAMMSI